MDYIFHQLVKNVKLTKYVYKEYFYIFSLRLQVAGDILQALFNLVSSVGALWKMKDTMGKRKIDCDQGIVKANLIRSEI